MSLAVTVITEYKEDGTNVLLNKPIYLSDNYNHDGGWIATNANDGGKEVCSEASKKTTLI